MDDKTYKRYEREISAAVNGKPHGSTEQDRFVLSVVEKAKWFFRVYDAIENKNTYPMFCAIFLSTKNVKKSILEYADDFGLSERSLIRHKRKVLRIYVHIYESCRK